jgi:signal transduction histidine kinase
MRIGSQKVSFYVRKSDSMDFTKYHFEHIKSINKIVSDICYLEKYDTDTMGLRIDWSKLVKDANIIGDMDKLSIAFYNILDNAIKYSECDESSKYKDILIESELTQNIYKIRFTNFGIVVKDEDRSTIFHSKTRGTNEEMDVIEGSGQGLYHCKMIFEKHCGSITLESSSKEKGTTFIVQFDLEKNKTIDYEIRSNN